MDNLQQYDSQYMPGLENRVYRYWFYLNNGLNIVNQFRNLILAILGLYFVLKIDNWLILPAIFIPSIVILTIVGYYITHRVNKVMDWLSLRFATHYGIKQFNLQQNISETLERIEKKL